MNLLKTFIAWSLLTTWVYADDVIKCKEPIPAWVQKILESKSELGNTFWTYAWSEWSISYSIEGNKVSWTYAGPNWAWIINCEINKN